MSDQSLEFPPEIILHILEYLVEYRRELENASLASHAWCGPAQSLLHSFVYIASEEKVNRLVERYVAYPHLKRYVNAMAISGHQLVSFSEGSIEFEKTIDAPAFGRLMALLNEGGGGGIRELLLESFSEWNESMSEGILLNFPSLERLGLTAVVFECVRRDIRQLLAGMSGRLRSLSFRGCGQAFTVDSPSSVISEDFRTSPSSLARLTHLMVSPTNGRTHLPILEILTGPAIIDITDLRSLTLGWWLSSGSWSLPEPRWKTDFVPILDKFLLLVGPHITQLQIATPSSLSLEMSLNKTVSLGNIISIQLLDYFPSLRTLVFSAEATPSNRLATDYGHIAPVAFFHVHCLLKTINAPTKIEKIEIRLSQVSPKGLFDLPPAWYPLRDLLLSSSNFPNLRKGSDGLLVVDENRDRLPGTLLS